ncbi:hypothetical protein GCM10027596_36580 [Nocardioides korecus]
MWGMGQCLALDAGHEDSPAARDVGSGVGALTNGLEYRGGGPSVVDRRAIAPSVDGAPVVRSAGVAGVGVY